MMPISDTLRCYLADIVAQLLRKVGFHGKGGEAPGLAGE